MIITFVVPSCSFVVLVNCITVCCPVFVALFLWQRRVACAVSRVAVRFVWFRVFDWPDLFLLTIVSYCLTISLICLS